MQLTAIQVECYAGGHRADETPRRFRLKDIAECASCEWIEIEAVLDRWYQIESLPEWPRANYFKVRGTDQRAYLLKHDQELDQWFVGQSWEKSAAP